ncbi:MAG TPA: FAD-dependent oxidoreductase [Acidobacteriaceae bacterium]|jgi:glycine oxidase|nr:FAD-dependent oxidoreductase [Acidobacteriaceae bacterium]
MHGSDVAIAGAGIMGLATACELAAAGSRVTVFDQSEAMSEASRAAAGMLGAADPENPAELQALASLSLARYPEFLERVEGSSKKKIPVRTTSTVQGMHQVPQGATALSEAEIQALTPGANTAGFHFLHLDEKSFDAWDLAEALPTAAREAGVELREHTSVLSVRGGNAGVEIVTAAGTFSAGTFVNATGAWAPSLEPALPVTPRKGHMLTAELPGDLQMLPVLRTPNVYIIPRGGNRYTVGSTVEDTGFDRNVDPLRIQELFARAVALWPPLRGATITETWIGFRPGSGDGLPIIDQTSEKTWVATGHFKNGILLGPGTGRVLSQWILGLQPEIDLSPFRAGRFALLAASS